MRKVGSVGRALLLACSLAACVSPIELHRAVTAYDDVANDVLARQLLLNVARASDNEPLHFTGLSSIASTFNFQVTAGMTPPLGGMVGGFHLAPLFGTVYAENPTFSIVPIEGEEFTKRLLAPFPESTLTLLLRQGADVDLALRMMAGEYRTENDGEKVSYLNTPHDHIGYEMFRRIVLHLSTIQDRNALYAEPLIFEDSWTMPEASVTPDSLLNLEKELSVEHDEKAHVYRLTKRTIGRIIVTNYDPASLSNDERAKLNDEAEQTPDDEMLIDIRYGHTGGEYPLHGRFRLRSFYNVIGFLGRAITEDREYDVPGDPRTPHTSENPAFTLAFVASDGTPSGVDRSIRYQGRYYAVAPDKGYAWNRKGFVLLYQLFQLSVAKLGTGVGPAITIAK